MHEVLAEAAADISQAIMALDRAAAKLASVGVETEPGDDLTESKVCAERAYVEIHDYLEGV